MSLTQTESNYFSKKPPLDPQFFKSCTNVSKWNSVALCISIYILVILLAWVGGSFSNYLLSPLAILIIAGLQNHLLILFHEGSHWLMHPNKNLNDFLTDLFCGAPLLQYVRNYRLVHWNHHRDTGLIGKDPEIEIYQGQNYFYARRNKIETFWMLLKDVFLINLIFFQWSFYKYAWTEQKKGSHRVFTGRESLLFFGLWLPLGFASFYFNFWQELAIFWFLPLFTVTFFFLKLHGYGEHNGEEGPTEFERTWFHQFPSWVNFLIYPIYSGFHIEHHLFPTVPWYHMKRLRHFLLKNPYYDEISKSSTLDGVFFGKRTIFKTMISGTDKYTNSDEWKNKIQSREKVLHSLKST